MSDARRYIGVDLAAWYSKKTKIAVLELEEDNKNKSKLKLVELISETSLPKNSTSESWDKCNIYRKNELLVEYITKEANNNALVGIDCPFAIPYYLRNEFSKKDYEKYQNTKQYFPKNMENFSEETKNKRELLNPVIFDNSARFVYEKTNQIVLAPAGDKIGKMTARMLKIIDTHGKELNIIRKLETFEEFRNKTKNLISTIEVFPTATIFQIAKSQNLLHEYFKAENNKEKPFDRSKKLGITSYKGAKRSNPNHFTYKYKDDNKDIDNKKRMLDLIKPYIVNLNEWETKIKTDDDYDAIICALTAYLVDQKDGYEKPEDEKKFTNSFIYIPKVK